VHPPFQHPVGWWNGGFFLWPPAAQEQR